MKKRSVLNKREIAQCAYVGGKRGFLLYATEADRDAHRNPKDTDGYPIHTHNLKGVMMFHEPLVVSDYRLACAIVRAIREEIARRPDLQEEILRQSTISKLKGD